MKKMVLSAAVLCAAATSAADVVLVEDSVAKCRVAVAADAHPALKFGAREIAKYLGVATGAKVEVNGGDASLLTVGVRLARGDEMKALRDDGFTIDATERGVEIIGANPRGALYGCYEILKKHAGMRWIIPGDEGEYCVHKGRTVRMPAGRRTVNPYLRVRKTRGDTPDAWLWHARNNMSGETHRRRYQDPVTGKPTKDAARLEELCVDGNGTAGNSHIMMDMMCGWAGRKTKEAIDALYREHPEYFPLISGKRIKIYGAGDANPCVSNAALLDLMAENLYRQVCGPHGAQDYVTIGNNDTPIWCECARCRAIDAPELVGTKGQRADRYWYAVMEIARRIWKRDPSLKLGGWAYQDFWYPPARVKLDPRLRVFISFNNQCWRHNVEDPKCTVNAEWRKIFSAWRKTGHPLVVNRDEISCGGTGGGAYAPMEKTVGENLLAYRDYGCAGSSFCVYAPFQYTSLAKKGPFAGKADRWHAMWHTCYMGARMMWNPDEVDFDAELEEVCRLYYGEAAWKAGMKEFREVLKKAWLDTPGCFGWGLGTPLGRCLDKAGTEERLVALMGRALAAAEASGDERAAAHMRREKHVFERTWIAEREQYLKNFKELNVYRRAGAIKIDGVLDDEDWKNADALGNFKPGGMTAVRDPKRKVVQSSVRVVYDEDNLYVSVECLEPDTRDIVAAKSLEAGIDRWWSVIGEHVEIFYNYPDMAERYYHVAVNPYGVVIPAIQNSGTNRDTGFRTAAKIATKILKDRWILEMAIPTSEIGMKCFDGATWKLNVGRSRHVKTLAAAETSSCCNGAFHGAANFVNIKFVPARGKGLYQSRNVSSWSNAGFDDVVPNAKLHKAYRWNFITLPEGDDSVPNVWYGRKLRGEFRTENGNRFVRVLPGGQSYLSQYYVSDAPGKVRVSFKARGKGKLSLWTGLYSSSGSKTGYDFQKGSSKAEYFDVGPEWKTFVAERSKNGLKTERMSVRFSALEGSSVDIDDVYVSPVGL